jgi:hypothetical protein
VFLERGVVWCGVVWCGRREERRGVDYGGGKEGRIVHHFFIVLYLTALELK